MSVFSYVLEYQWACGRETEGESFKVPSFLILETRRSIRGSQSMGELFIHVLIPSSLSSCWRSHQRVHVCLLTLKLDLAFAGSSFPPLFLRCVFFPLFPYYKPLQGRSLERVMFRETIWLYTQLNPVKAFVPETIWTIYTTEPREGLCTNS